MTAAESVARERRTLLRRRVVTAAAACAATSLVLVVGGVTLLGEARWLALPRAVPFVFWGVALGLNAWLLRVVRRGLRDLSPGRIAAQIEREQRLRAGTVQGAIEVAELGVLGRRAADAVAQDLARRGPALVPAMRARMTRGAGLASGAALVAATGTFVVTPAYGDGLLALLHPVRAYTGALVPPLAIASLPAEVLRGEPLRLRIAAPGRASVTVHHRQAGGIWARVNLPVRADTAVVDLGPMQRGVQLLASDGRTTSDTASIAVADRPYLGDIVLRAVYPAYLQRAPELLAVGAGVQVPRGTVLHVSGRASVALGATALAAGSDTIPFTTDGHTFSGRLTVESSARWTWVAAALHGNRTLDVPEPMRIDAIGDSVPVAEIVSPVADSAVAPGQQVPLVIGAGDDRGLAAVYLEITSERDGQAGGGRRDVLVQRPGASWEGPALVDLAAFGARAGDVVRVRAIAVDASPWAQRGTSRELRIRVLTAEERRDLARSIADSAVAAAQSAVRAQRALAQRTEAAARTRDRTTSSGGSADAASAAGTMSHEAGERARTIAREQRQLAERVDALREAARQLEQALAQAGAMDSSLARQLRDVQALMRQALTPELLAQMQRLEQAAQGLQGDAARQALQELAAMQQRLREQLERSAEMLQRAAHEGAMQTLTDEARELAQQQRALADSAARGEDDRAPRAEALADRTERYADDVAALRERLARDRAAAAAEGTAEARRAAQRAEQLLRGDAARGAEPGTRDAASPPNSPRDPGAQARDAAAQMDRAAEAMQQAREAQVNEWKQELTRELDRAVQEMQQMAREERALAQQAAASAPAQAGQQGQHGQEGQQGQQGSSELRDRQGAVQRGLEQTSQRLQQAGKRSSHLSGGSQRAVSDAQERVDAAARQLAQAGAGTSRDAAASALTDAADALGRAAASLARDRERAASAQSASGFEEMMQQLQEMAKQQGNINAQAEGLVPMPGGQLSAEGVQRARALGRQQREVAEGLDEVSEAIGGSKTADLAREARELAELLDAARVDGRTTERQEQLFRRLLDAGRALEKEEREDSERRESRAATGAHRFTPGSAPASGAEARRFREPTWDELRGLTPEERRAVIEYFRRINAAGTP